jgi:hypothetical protein
VALVALVAVERGLVETLVLALRGRLIQVVVAGLDLEETVTELLADQVLWS